MLYADLTHPECSRQVSRYPATQSLSGCSLKPSNDAEYVRNFTLSSCGKPVNEANYGSLNPDHCFRLTSHCAQLNQQDNLVVANLYQCSPSRYCPPIRPIESPFHVKPQRAEPCQQISSRSANERRQELTHANNQSDRSPLPHSSCTPQTEGVHSPYTNIRAMRGMAWCHSHHLRSS